MKLIGWFKLRILSNILIIKELGIILIELLCIYIILIIIIMIHLESVYYYIHWLLKLKVKVL